jgi:glutamate formiminotransferase/formiminotetrahydrofolate cyclodeaminase
MRLCLKAVERGRASSATDAAVGFLAAKAGLEGALLNVKINLEGIKDGDFTGAVKKEIEALSTQASADEREYRALLSKTLGF